MSHDGSWRAACLNRNWIRILHSESHSVARGVTAPGVGSGALLALFRGEDISDFTQLKRQMNVVGREQISAVEKLISELWNQSN